MIVFVVGIYKSGTSYLTTLAEKVGPPLVIDREATCQGVTREYNIREAYEVNLLNNDIFEWYKQDIFYFSPQVFDEYKPNYEHVQKIKKIYQRYNYDCIMKDPRLIGSLPLWLDAIPDEIPVKILWSERNAEDICKSFMKDEWSNSKLKKSVEDTVKELQLKLAYRKSLEGIGETFRYEHVVNNEDETLERIQSYLNG